MKMGSNIRKSEKRILFFAPTFFGYYRRIEQNFKEKGWIVDTILEDFVNNSYFYRFFWVKKKSLRLWYAKRYYLKEISRLNASYDVVFVVRGEALSEELLGIIKRQNPEAMFVMYQWDSVRNNPNALMIEKMFDRVYTFDMNDAKDYGWIYRPLFFCKAEQKGEKKIDFAYIGTLYYQRGYLLKQIREYCVKNNYSLFDYLFCPKLMFFIHKYLMKDARYCDTSYRDINFSSLSYHSIVEQYESARILVDYSADDQAGLTMRTIESIGNSCKLITNNKSIINTDIYSFGNIFVYDINAFDIPKDFVEKPYEPLPEKMLQYYSLGGWVDCILGEYENAI